jgi:hypothetical protein
MNIYAPVAQLEERQNTNLEVCRFDAYRGFLCRGNKSKMATATSFRNWIFVGSNPTPGTLKVCYNALVVNLVKAPRSKRGDFAGSMPVKGTIIH